MPPTVNASRRREQAWIYAALTVIDGHRRLKPTQVAFDRIYFATPPRLNSRQVEIILINGKVEQRHVALVLPHSDDATRIPIRLLAADESRGGSVLSPAAIQRDPAS